MNLMRRPLRGYGMHSHPVIHITPGFPGRPCDGHTVRTLPYTMSGPDWKGMDPSDPATYVRNWAPCDGMIGYLNFDGAAQQSRTPTGGNQRGRQERRPRKLRVGI